MKEKVVEKGSTVLLRTAVIIMGGIVAALCVFALPSLWPEIDEEFPRVAYAVYAVFIAMYLSAIPFFVALFQTLKLLGYVDKNKAFSKHSVRALKLIKRAALSISLIYTAALPFFYVWADDDDAPGLIVIGMIFVGASLAVAVFAAVLQRLLTQAIAIKSENELTV